MKPYWPNVCFHSEEAYVESLKWLDSHYDIYVYSSLSGGQYVCLRYGKQLKDYLAPGSIVNLIQQANESPMMKEVLRLILAAGEIEFHAHKYS